MWEAGFISHGRPGWATKGVWPGSVLDGLTLSYTAGRSGIEEDLFGGDPGEMFKVGHPEGKIETSLLHANIAMTLFVIFDQMIVIVQSERFELKTHVPTLTGTN